MRDGRELHPVTGRSRLEIEMLAFQFLFSCAPECARAPGRTPVLKVFEDVLPEMGFRSLVMDMPEHIHGFTDPSGMTVVLNAHIYTAAENDGEMARFAVGHEIGHAILHAQELQAKGTQLVDGRGLKLYKRHEIPAYMDPEWQANAFSAAFLMPAETMRSLADARGGRLRANVVSSVFGASHTAASFRLKDLKIPFGGPPFA